MVPRVWMNRIDEICGHLAWLRTRGLHSVSNSILAGLEDLVYNGPKRSASEDSTTLAPPPGGLYSTLAVEHPMIRHLAYEFAVDVAWAKSGI